MKGIKERVYEEEDDPFLIWLRQSKGLSKTTIYNYYKYYRQFLKLGEYDNKTLNNFLQNNKNNKVVRGFLKAMLDFLKEQGYNIDFEFPDPPSGRKTERIIKSFSENQLRLVRKGCYEKSKGWGIIFDILRYGALRRIEVPTIKINSFKWSDFFDNNCEKYCELVVEGKGKKHRPVLIPPSVISTILESLMESGLINPNMDRETIMDVLENNDNLLFPNLYERKVWSIVNKVSKEKIGISMRPHEIRHHRATELHNQGISIRDVQQYLGHSNPMITEIYLHTTQDRSLNNIRESIEE